LDTMVGRLLEHRFINACSRNNSMFSIFLITTYIWLLPHMNRLLILPVLLLTLLVGTPALSTDYQKGYAVIQSGDFATALRE
jgi:hypothetical protein